MLRKLAIHYLLGLDALVRLIATLIIIGALIGITRFVASSLGEFVFDDPANPYIQIVWFVIFVPFIAKIGVSAVRHSIFDDRLRQKLDQKTSELTPPAPPPSPRSLPAGR